MPQNTQHPQFKGPQITKADGLKRLLAQRKRGLALLDARPLKDSQETLWSDSTIDIIEKTFGEDSRYVNTFVGPVRVLMGSRHGSQRNQENEDAAQLSRRGEVLDSIIGELKHEMEMESPPSSSVPDDFFWSDIHTSIVAIARPRYEAQHYADCVEAAFKEVNSTIKAHVKLKNNVELDGASLMNTAFSPNKPIVLLEDQSTESGRNIQQGYMQIFAGSIIGIRNPKAHANIDIDALRARHHLYLASLLMSVFDERIT